jgi:hypothetical protein
MSARAISVVIALAWMFLGSVLTLATIALIVKAAVRPVRYTRPLPREVVSHDR